MALKGELMALALANKPKKREMKMDVNDRHPPLIINLGDDSDDNEDESNSSDDAEEVLATPLDDTF
uniref:Uncharacterized protein n=1 Tax=Timema monikensis TaxID=170555 RepID=A0A7R9EK29_9NEOP|nr:unnamed protein product [Timema monikensis]